jgi:hypothetical protein
MAVLISIFQCIIPCIEGLFPEPHNTTILELLYIFATRHALAKLHVHTDTSPRLLDTATTALGAALRYFARVTCPAFPTVETKAEHAKRQRQQASTTSSHTTASKTTAPAAATSTTAAATTSASTIAVSTTTASNTTLPASSGRQPRTFSLKTIKLHFLGDYVACIKMFGATDSYNSALVSKPPVLSCLSTVLITIRVKTAITALSLMRSQRLTTRRPPNNLARWTMSTSRFDASQTTSKQPVSPSLAPTPPHLRSMNHQQTQFSASQKVSSQGYTSRIGHGSIATTLR